LKIQLEGTKENCNMSYQVCSRIDHDILINSLKICTFVECSLKGKVEEFIVDFRNVSDFMQDFGQNKLITSTIRIKSIRYLYVSDVQQIAVESTGNFFRTATLLTLGLVLGMNLIQSMAVNSFWDFVNMLQVIVYIPLISFSFPYNFQTFITKYLTISRITVPFKLFGDYIPNPLSLFDAFILGDIEERFEKCGYESYSFLYNMSEQLSTWCCLLFWYGIICILVKLLPENRYFLNKLIINK